MNRRMLTTGQVAAFCGVHFRTVLRWISRGELKAYKLPGSRGDRRVAVEDFIAFLKKHHMPIPLELASPTTDRALIVDDDVAMVNAIERVLHRNGFETSTATDGFRAGALLSTFQPTVMTLDLQMPGLGGLDVLRFVRRTPQFQNTRVVVVSAMPRAQLDEALAAGADDVLEKPFHHETLLKKVRG